jgi:hypothetical protein
MDPMTCMQTLQYATSVALIRIPMTSVLNALKDVDATFDRKKTADSLMIAAALEKPEHFIRIPLFLIS